MNPINPKLFLGWTDDFDASWSEQEILDWNRSNILPHTVEAYRFNDFFSGGEIWVEVNNWLYDNVGLYKGSREQWEHSMFDGGPHRFNRYQDTQKSSVMFEFSHLEDAELFKSVWLAKNFGIDKNYVYIFGDISDVNIEIFLEKHNHQRFSFNQRASIYKTNCSLIKIIFNDDISPVLFKLFFG